MDKFLTLAFLFYIGSLFGWVLELLFRSIIINKGKKWMNPGFLTGPCLPIYGFGLCVLYLICQINLSFISNITMQKAFQIFLITIAMTAIEYIAGIVFTKIIHVKLWDYSTMWGNIQGIICPLYSLFWGILATIYYFLINPYIIDSVNWLFGNLAFSFFIGLFYGILLMDVAHSFNLVVKLKKMAKEYDILLLKLEEIKSNIREDAIKRKEKIHYIFAFRSNRTLAEILVDYKKKYEAKLGKKE